MQTTTERPEFYERIDAALERRDKLASAIEALSSELDSKQVSPDVRNLLVTLRGTPTAEQFVQDASKAAWLPILLRGLSSETSREELQQIMSDVTIATESRRNRWRNSAYPLVVGGSAILLFVFLSLTVIPTFQEMFREFQLRLPWSTKAVLATSSFINARPFFFCVLLLALTLAAWSLNRIFSLCMRAVETSWLLGSLVSGNSESVKAMGRFTSTVAELLCIGAPLKEAIVIAGRASQNLRFRNVSATISREMGAEGKFKKDSVVAHNFPSLVIHAFQAAPNGSPSIELLRHLSTIYFDRVRQRYSWSTGMMGPLSILGVGLCVGVVVVALFMPLFTLITSLSGNGG